MKEERERKERERQEEERREEERKEEEENQRLIEMREKLKTRSAKLVRRISSTESTADVELPEQNVEPEPELTEEPETETDKPEEIQEPEVETEFVVTEDSGPEVVEQEQETAPEEDTVPKPETESDEIHPEPQPELQPEPPSEVVETAEEHAEQEAEDQKGLIEGETLSPEVEKPDESADVVEQQADEGSNEGALSPVTVVDVPVLSETEDIPVSGTETEAIPIPGPEPETVSLSVPEPPEMFPMSTQTEEEEPIPPVETECRETQVKLLFLLAN